MISAAHRSHQCGHTNAETQLRSVAYERKVDCMRGKKPCTRLRRRWQNNIKMDLTYMRCDGLDWTDLTQKGTGGGLVWSS
jgi:hypothetical protein